MNDLYTHTDATGGRITGETTNALSSIGHNRPPSPIDFTRIALADLSEFLSDNPVIQAPEQAKLGTLFVERCRKTLQDLDDARKHEVGPLNEQVKQINALFRCARAPLDNVLGELRKRLTDFAAREEAARFKAAEEARKLAEAAEMEARRAEEAEREAKEGATFGEITDVAAAVVEADQAFNAFERANRAANIAERDTHVRLQSQLGGRALSLRTTETLIVDSPADAVMAIGDNEGINEAIRTAARAYRKQFGSLPPGVRAEHTRNI